MQNKQIRMKELIELLQEASKAYYANDTEIISNFEYDKLYDELQALEEESGVILANSPTVQVGYEAVDELPKEKHEKPMLSLGKTKSREELQEWIGDKEGLLSWKLDGLTIVLTYQDGKLTKAVTRGNGEIGEVITNNAKVFQNIPLQIAYKDTLILRGEAVITYSDFDLINEAIEVVEEKYKNPRNLCSGSVRQLNNEITAKRKVRFYAFSLVKAEGVTFQNSREKQMLFLKEQGFSIVDYKKVSKDTIIEEIESFAKEIEHYDIPSDGLVLVYDDIAYGQALGTTAKFPRDSIAFKWADETKETTLKEIEWSPSRTGLINPVAIFEPVELEGTTVSRASVHNVSILRQLKLGVGDQIMVYKANMIIPQIAENLTGSDSIVIPTCCPVCGEPTEIRMINEVQTLYCQNPVCDAKKIKSFTHFVGRNAMNIDGLSEATLEKFIAKGFIHEFADIFDLAKHHDEMVTMEGFGEKSYTNLIASLETAKHTTMARFLYSLGIDNIGNATAKLICKHFHNDFEAMKQASVEEVSKIDGVGEVIAKGFCDYIADEANCARMQRLLNILDFEEEAVNTAEQILENITFVITGSLEQFANRDAMKDYIESLGGKVTGSVTKKTDYLINNDNLSTSSKNKKAKELGIPILTEEEFVQKFGKS